MLNGIKKTAVKIAFGLTTLASPFAEATPAEDIFAARSDAVANEIISVEDFLGDEEKEEQLMELFKLAAVEKTAGKLAWDYMSPFFADLEQDPHNQEMKEKWNTLPREERNNYTQEIMNNFLDSHP
jgi:hypothetical protein